MSRTDINGDIRIEVFVLDKSDCKKPVYFKLQRRMEQNWKICELSAQKNSANLAFFPSWDVSGPFFMTADDNSLVRGKTLNCKSAPHCWTALEEHYKCAENFARCDLQTEKDCLWRIKTGMFREINLLVRKHGIVVFKWKCYKIRSKVVYHQQYHKRILSTGWHCMP